MLGAITGDICGTPYEFHNIKTKDFELFKNGKFSDDTVMTCAVARALMDSGKDSSNEEIKKIVVKEMKYFGDRYFDAGYGGRFKKWIRSNTSEPYGSWGNGSAMRVSPAGWLYDSLERTIEVAGLTAEVTHNHPGRD